MTTIEAPKGAARRNTVWRAAVLLAAVLAPQVASAQDKGTLNPQPLPPLTKPDDPATPAKELFGRKTAPASLQARTIGFYSKGCLAGAVALPINGAGETALGIEADGARLQTRRRSLAAEQLLGRGGGIVGLGEGRQRLRIEGALVLRARDLRREHGGQQHSSAPNGVTSSSALRRLYRRHACGIRF